MFFYHHPWQSSSAISWHPCEPTVPPVIPVKRNRISPKKLKAIKYALYIHTLPRVAPELCKIIHPPIPIYYDGSM